MRTLLLGATGLVGSELLRLLLEDPRTSAVTVVARRAGGVRHPKLTEVVFDLDSLERHPELFVVDAVYCALGTTIKVAGSQEAFRFVDHELPLRAARLALERGAQHYLLVSALGANAKSRVFYNRVKGEVERDLIALGFPRVTIARPSLLLGPRAEHRRGEEWAKRFSWLMPGKYKPIEAVKVATSLVSAAHVAQSGVKILESREMQ